MPKNDKPEPETLPVPEVVADEVAGEDPATVTVRWDNRDWTVTNGGLHMPAEAMLLLRRAAQLEDDLASGDDEAAPDLLAANVELLQALLGRRSWARFTSSKRNSTGDVVEFLQAIMKAWGEVNRGE